MLMSFVLKGPGQALVDKDTKEDSMLLVCAHICGQRERGMYKRCQGCLQMKQSHGPRIDPIGMKPSERASQGLFARILHGRYGKRAKVLV